MYSFFVPTSNSCQFSPRVSEQVNNDIFPLCVEPVETEIPFATDSLHVSGLQFYIVVEHVVINHLRGVLTARQDRIVD